MLFSKSHSLIIASLLMVPALTQAAIPLGNESTDPAANMPPPGLQPPPNMGLAPGGGPPPFGPPKGEFGKDEKPPFGPPSGEKGPRFPMGRGPGKSDHPPFKGQMGPLGNGLKGMPRWGDDRGMGHAGPRGGMKGRHGSRERCSDHEDECSSKDDDDEDSESESCGCSSKKSHKQACGGDEEADEDECGKNESCGSGRNHGGKHRGAGYPPSHDKMMGGPGADRHRDFDHSKPDSGFDRQLEHGPDGSMPMDHGRSMGGRGGCKKRRKQKCGKCACKCCECGCDDNDFQHPRINKIREGSPELPHAPTPHPLGPGLVGPEPLPNNPLVNSTVPLNTSPIVPPRSAVPEDDDDISESPAPELKSPSPSLPTGPTPTVPDVANPVSSLPGSLRSEPGSHRGLIPESSSPIKPSPTVPDVANPVSSLPGSLRSQPGSHRGLDLDSPSSLIPSSSVSSTSSTSSISPEFLSSISPMGATSSPSTDAAAPRIDNPLIIPSDLVSAGLGNRAQVGLSVVFVAAAALFV